ncbi:MAG: DNA translocase FtsK [Aggregatilineales bacterium]
MAQPKSADKNKHVKEETLEEEANKKRVYEVQPEFWDALFDTLPPWIDEISAIGLLIFGVVSFLSLTDVSSNAPLSQAWSQTLTSLFGYGSLIVSAGIFALGVVILLPKVGLRIPFPPRRILAIQIIFLSILALLHLSSGDSELRALARAGEGGGYVGWGMSVIPDWAVGNTLAIIFWAVILVISIGITIGIRASQVSEWVQKLGETLHAFGTKVAPPRQQKIKPITVPTSLPSKPTEIVNKSSIVRIRPNIGELPPSLRPQPKTPEPVRDYDEVDERLEGLVTGNPQPEHDPMSLENTIGEILPKKGKSREQFVRRPDGRIKRFFNVESMKEDKKVGRREKSLPTLDLLQDIEIEPPDEQEINRNVVLIENTLLEFDINVDVVEVKVGPTVTQYAVQPFREVTNDEGDLIKERTRLSKIAALANDLALSLSTRRLRLETPVPGHSYMGVEVPNKNPSIVALRSVYESRSYYEQAQKSKSPLFIPLGRDVSGNPIGIDLATMPHLLIAGTTGSGKSVCIAAIAIALLLSNPPDQVKLVMLDPKMVELSRFNGLPHLIGPVETDLERIIGVLRWCTREMDRRYKLLEENAARNIDIFNSRLGQRRKKEHLPYMVVLVDEVGDLMMSKPEETEKTITRLAQMARAVGIHLIVATQRPSVDVITGLIKANFPSRIAFSVASSIDSRVIIDAVGAETLLGKGDMLYQAQDAAGPRRLQGCFVTDNEVREVVSYWTNWAEENHDEDAWNSAPWERGLTRREFLAETDPMLEDAIELVVNEQEASASQIQRKLGLGYPRAARIIDLLEELGVIGEQVAGGRTRKVLIEKGKDPFKEILDRRSR